MQGLVYVGTAGGLFGYLVWFIATRVRLYSESSPFEGLVTVLLSFAGGFVVFVIFGLGVYYIVFAAFEKKITPLKKTEEAVH